MPERRMLDFASMDQIMPDVERLVEGHRMTGRWTLAQVLYHLATAIRLSTQGNADSSFREASAARRERFFRSRRIAEGRSVPHPSLIPPPHADLNIQRKALQETIEHFLSSTGPFPGHPLLGPLSKDEWHQFHCIHCAHHLGFAVSHRLNVNAGTAANGLITDGG